MRVKLRKQVASPWGTAETGEQLEVPDNVGATWIAAGVAESPPPIAPAVEPAPAPEPPKATSKKAAKAGELS